MPMTNASAPVCLRPYQTEAIDRVRDRIRAGARRVVVVLPTGGGKTHVASHIIASAVARGSRVLFLAHRRELVNQAYRKLLVQGLPEEQVGVLMAADPRRRPMAPVQVASIDTLRHRARPPAELVFVDECHRALAKSYRAVAAAYPRALHRGRRRCAQPVARRSPRELPLRSSIRPRPRALPAGSRSD